ncbi:hypothetical protein OIE62_38255 [Streptomyces scopuliridis]|uniref:Uncharacterized protein n=1 Tax=Streptomyces scopuliridis TaxID=452529 RepID=A0ACD4ZC72_9ACTN|nr:hypothetical protein [Streptomyces scopuliridis]WSB96017.1 hypothetical protein OG835_02665 [Streptomyces scopuliridis]WSC10276.1 hypothetical protein OIE62_38255 [Streptomyces scopuliridis]
MPDSTSAGAAQGAPGDARLLALRAEVEKLITEARIGARRAQRRAKLWHAAYLSLGFPAAVLAGISGAAGLASAGARVPAAILALLAAGFSAGSTFLRADARHMTNLRRRYAWQNLETRARLVLAYDAYEGPEQLHTALLGLHELRIAVPSSALILAEQQASTYQAPVGVPAPTIPAPTLPPPAVQPPTVTAPTVQQLTVPAPTAQPPAIPSPSPSPSPDPSPEPPDPVG